MGVTQEEEVVVAESISMNAVQPAAAMAMNFEPPTPTAYATPLNGTTPTPRNNVNSGIAMNGQPPTAYATPVASSGLAGSTTLPPVAASTPMHDQEKLGSKCCGCCCDFKRAVIIVDILGMIGAVFSLVSLAVPVEYQNLDPNGEEVDDDAVLDEMRSLSVANAVIGGVGLLAFAIPIYGALQYNIPMIGYGIVWLLASFIALIVVEVLYTPKINDAMKEGQEESSVSIASIVVSGIFTVLYMYPHMGLMNEIRQGIMSRETYPREEFSCCCI